MQKKFQMVKKKREENNLLLLYVIMVSKDVKLINKFERLQIKQNRQAAPLVGMYYNRRNKITCHNEARNRESKLLEIDKKDKWQTDNFFR